MRISKIKFEALEDLSRLVVLGFEGDGDDGAGDGGDGGGDDGGLDGDDGDGGDGDDGAGGDDSHDDDSPDDLEGLKKALRAERELRKKAEKGLKLTEREKRKLEKAQQDIADAEKGETEAAKKKADEADTKVKGLAAKLRQRDIESAITKAARTARFRDPDDVIAQLQRSNFAGIEVDQDDDDPSDIEIDEKSVEKAVKAIATKKPHWLLADGEDTASGSKFGGKGGDKNKTTEQQLAERFPALRNRLKTGS